MVKLAVGSLKFLFSGQLAPEHRAYNPAALRLRLLRLISGGRCSLLPGVEHADRSAMAHHVDWTA